MTPHEYSTPLLKYCQKHLHLIPLSETRCKECRKLYFKEYRVINKEKLRITEVVRYQKKFPNSIRKPNATARQEAIDLYYADPKHCKECGEMIQVRPKEKISQLKKRQFCDRKCSAAFNKRAQTTGRHCKKCGGVFTRTEDHKSGNYCPACLIAVKRPNTTGQTTKGELFDRRSNWQSARSSIRSHAETTYNQSGKSRSCAICEYSRHIEIAHITPVKSFPITALISEINHIDNLVAFCPTHHWEFDHGFLKFNAGSFNETAKNAKGINMPKRKRDTLQDQPRLFPVSAESVLTIQMECATV